MLIFSPVQMRKNSATHRAVQTVEVFAAAESRNDMNPSLNDEEPKM